MEDKESIYDEQISPLMTQIIEICKSQDMPFFAVFQFAEKSFCVSQIIKRKDVLLLHALDALYRSREDGGVNVDKFMFWMMKMCKDRGHSSLVLSQLGVESFPSKPPSPTGA